MNLAKSTEEGIGRFLKTTYDVMVKGEQASKDLLSEKSSLSFLRLSIFSILF